MNPGMAFLAAVWGLTEEDVEKLGKGETLRLNIGGVFCNNDEHVTEIRAEHLVRGLKRVTPRRVLELFIWAETIMESKTAAEAEELERAVGDAAGEGMGTARSDAQAPSTHPWTPDDKIPN